MKKELINKAYDMGYEAFPSFPSTPRKNSDFMRIVSNCSFSDEKGGRLRAKMYKEYIKGWVRAFLDKVWNLN